MNQRRVDLITKASRAGLPAAEMLELGLLQRELRKELEPLDTQRLEELERVLRDV